MKNSQNIIFAPRLDALISRAVSAENDLDENTRRLILALFQKLQIIAACGDDERRELWLTAERGSIEDFGKYDEYFDEGEVENPREFEELWLGYYPKPHEWYKLTTITHSKGQFYAVFLNEKLALQIDTRVQSGYPVDCSELANWILNSLDDCVEKLKLGIYNEFVNQNLPHKKRIGKIRGEEFWRIFPEVKEEYFKDITPDEIKAFTKTMQIQPVGSPTERLPEMTASIFFDCCRLGYEANNYKGIHELTPKELYYRHADGRDDRLQDIPDDAVDAFRAWYYDRTRLGGHPWEVCRGGNSTHVSLYVKEDERGWWFELAGSSWGRSVEAVKFYMAKKYEIGRAHV